MTHIYHWCARPGKGGVAEEHTLPFQRETVIPERALAPVCVQTACVPVAGVWVCVYGLYPACYFYLISSAFLIFHDWFG